jgi:hypothetical protein
MSKYTMYYDSRQDAYRAMASRWSKWAETQKLAPYETMGISRFFKQIGRRFGLIGEFRELGVIK